MNNSNLYRLGLSILLAASVFWFWQTRIDELSYHTVGNVELIDLGDAKTYEGQKNTIKPNTFVKVSGILGNKAATLRGLRAGSFRYGRFQVRHLLGSKLYIEYDEEQYHQSFNPFKQVTVSGRLVPFGPSSELKKVREFFADYYNQPINDEAMLIVVDEKPRSEHRYAVIFILTMIIVLFSFFFSIKNFWPKKL